MGSKLGGDNVLVRYARERRRAALTHYVHELAIQDVHHCLDAALAESRQAPRLRAAKADPGRTQRERLENIGTASHTAVEKDRHAPVDRIAYLRKAFDRRTKCFLLPPAVATNAAKVADSLENSTPLVIPR